MNNPLFSICLACYKQEPYIREAVESMIRQTYRPLEIILADDCSPDGTPAILREYAKKYNDRAHGLEIVLSHNEKNLGVLGNFDKAMRRAKGDVIILAAGDDVSYPQRADRIAKAWQAHGDQTSCLIHDADRIDKQGAVVGHITAGSPWFPVGAAMAYTRRVVTAFRPIVCWDAYEDQVYVWRAQLLGDGITLNESLCGYRVNTGVTKAMSSIKDGEVNCIQHWLKSELQFYRDLDDAKAWLPDAVWQQRKCELDRKARILKGRLELLTGANAYVRIKGFSRRDWSTGVVNFTYDLFSVFPQSFRDRLIMAAKSLRGRGR